MEEQEKSLVKQEKAPLVTSSGVVGALVPQDLEQLWRMATMIAVSGMAPKGYQEKPEAIAVAIQMGMEVGMFPLQALANIAVINGRPAIFGDAALALVRASGKLQVFEEWFEGEEGTDNWTALCMAQRHGDGDPKTQKFSWKDAKRAKLVPAHPDSPWAKYPQRMMQMRARSWILRDKFTDVLKGLQTREEMADVVTLAPTANGSYEAKEDHRPAKEKLLEKLKKRNGETDPEIAEFKELKKPGLVKYLIDRVDHIPEFPDDVRMALDQKCRRVFSRSLEESFQTFAQVVESESTTSEPEPPEDRDPETGAVNGTGKLIVCPDMDGDKRYTSECEGRECRESCPSWTEVDQQ